MKLTLNKDFAIRHLAVALLFLGLGGWFFFDGAFVYPKMSDEELGRTIHRENLTARDRQDAIDRQFQFAALAGLAAVIIAFGVLSAKRKTLEWDDETMCGTLTGGKPLAFADVASVDDSKWEKKSLAVVKAKDGRSFTLDAWHHLGAKDLFMKLKRTEKEGVTT